MLTKLIRLQPEALRKEVFADAMREISHKQMISEDHMLQLGRKRPLAILIGFAILGMACVTTKAIYLDPSAPRFAPVQSDSVRIFTSESELDTLEFVRVAMIEATGSGEFTSQIGMYNAIRKKAGALGGNGVLLPQINEPGAGAKVAGAIFGTGTERKGNAIVIRVLGKKPVEQKYDW
jgi:hypothetical protein